MWKVLRKNDLGVLLWQIEEGYKCLDTFSLQSGIYFPSPWICVGFQLLWPKKYVRSEAGCPSSGLVSQRTGGFHLDLRGLGRHVTSINFPAGNTGATKTANRSRCKEAQMVQPPCLSSGLQTSERSSPQHPYFQANSQLNTPWKQKDHSAKLYWNS